jgi:hypothetical protein
MRSASGIVMSHKTTAKSFNPKFRRVKFSSSLLPLPRPPGSRFRNGRNKSFLVRTIRQATKYFVPEAERPHVHPRRSRTASK